MCGVELCCYSVVWCDVTRCEATQNGVVLGVRAGWFICHGRQGIIRPTGQVLTQGFHNISQVIPDHHISRYHTQHTITPPPINQPTS